jgi:hypothetical protein
MSKTTCQNGVVQEASLAPPRRGSDQEAIRTVHTRIVTNEDGGRSNLASKVKIAIVVAALIGASVVAHTGVSLLVAGFGYGVMRWRRRATQVTSSTLPTLAHDRAATGKPVARHPSSSEPRASSAVARPTPRGRNRASRSSDPPAYPRPRKRSQRSVTHAAKEVPMSVDRFRDDDPGYLSWVAANRDGYVMNIQRELNPSDARVHHAYCRTITGTPARGGPWTGAYIKLCSTDLAELDAWAKSRFGTAVTRCGICQPRSAA